jgi:A/G-specific adenine glycosylase
MPTAQSAIAAQLIAWQQRAGRHDLPWQTHRTPYRVWVSEIMLQQTQVVTVIPYYERFMQRFPDVACLAAAPLDEVLHLWSGLGYYARARNLHRAAQRVCSEFGGELPVSFEALASLPGIGRSTAGAILALSRGARHAILDGNARRVLARYFAVEGAVDEPGTRAQLWELAERCTPQAQLPEYTQAIMDLGATLCLRRAPRCAECPLAAGCSARRSARQHELPAQRSRRARPTRRAFMVLAQRHDGSVWLERRPESGVWGGLWCLPEFASAAAAHAYVDSVLGGSRRAPAVLPAVAHAFTHFDLEITPLLVRCAGERAVLEAGSTLWYDLRAPATVGLPAPICRLLEDLRERELPG